MTVCDGGNTAAPAIDPHWARPVWRQRDDWKSEIPSARSIRRWSLSSRRPKSVSPHWRRGGRRQHRPPVPPHLAVRRRHHRRRRQRYDDGVVGAAAAPVCLTQNASRIDRARALRAVVRVRRVPRLARSSRNVRVAHPLLIPLRLVQSSTNPLGVSLSAVLHSRTHQSTTDRHRAQHPISVCDRHSNRSYQK